MLQSAFQSHIVSVLQGEGLAFSFRIAFQHYESYTHAHLLTSDMLLTSEVTDLETNEWVYLVVAHINENDIANQARRQNAWVFLVFRKYHLKTIHPLMAGGGEAATCPYMGLFLCLILVAEKVYPVVLCPTLKGYILFVHICDKQHLLTV